MGIFNKLGLKKESKDTKKRPSKEKKKEEDVLSLVREDQPKKKPAAKKVKEETGLAYAVLVRPQITEKATMLASSGKYVFRVNPQANKSEIKKAIEKVYDVHVKKINIINVRGKKRRYGAVLGRTKDWKKAVVTVAPGERIEGVTATEQA